MVWSAECLNRSIVTRAHAPRQVNWYDAYRLSDGNIILLRNLGPMVGIAQNEAIRTVLKSFARSLPGVMHKSLVPPNSLNTAY